MKSATGLPRAVTSCHCGTNCPTEDLRDPALLSSS